MALLEINNLEYSYGQVKAVKGISMHVNEGEIVTLIGSNGAGKTTTLRSIRSCQPAGCPRRDPVRRADDPEKSRL